MKFHKHSDYEGRPAGGDNSELMQAADKLATFRRISWREAFGKIASPMFRLHRYRSAQNKLLLHALRELDNPDRGSCSA